MKNEFIKMLSEMYEIVPATILSLLSKNETYNEAGDEKTRKLFPKLEPLYTGRCSHRKENWWKDRHRILKKLNDMGLVDESIMLKYY